MSVQVPALPCPFQRMNLGFVSSASLRHRLMVSRPSPNDHDPGSPPYPAKDEITVTSGLHDVMSGGATSMGQTVQCPVHLPHRRGLAHLAAALAPGSLAPRKASMTASGTRLPQCTAHREAMAAAVEPCVLGFIGHCVMGCRVFGVFAPTWACQARKSTPSWVTGN